MEWREETEVKAIAREVWSGIGKGLGMDSREWEKAGQGRQGSDF